MNHDTDPITTADVSGLPIEALADDIRSTCDHADRILTEGLSDAQEVLEALLDGLRRTVDVHATPSEHLAALAWQTRRRYFAVVAGDLSSAQRQLALCLAVETARTSLLGDSELAAAVRAVVDADRELDDAVAEVSDPPACGGCENPLCPTRPGELCPRSAVDMARVDQVHAHGVCENCGGAPTTLCEPSDPSGVPVVLCAGCAGDALQPGHEIPSDPGMVVGVCGHRISGSEWADGFRTCEWCPADDGHSTPLMAAGLASVVLGVASLVAALSGSPVLGLVLGVAGGLTAAVVRVLGRHRRDGGVS